MNRHQVLTGAANSGDSCFSSGSVEGFHFVAYAAGCDIVILASDFQRVQIIAGVNHDNVQITGIDCCSDVGKIAVAYGSKICVFEPTPILHTDDSKKLNYQWCHTGQICTQCEVLSLAWNKEGSSLLSAGDYIQLWSAPDVQQTVEFFEREQLNKMTVPQVSVNQSLGHAHIGVGEHVVADLPEEESPANDGDPSATPAAATFDLPEWKQAWLCRPSTPVSQIGFSEDGLLFATCSKNDRLVKIWYENKRVTTGDATSLMLSPKKDLSTYSFIYIAHPRSVQGFSWRKTSKYMPRGSVANMLTTTCKDNISRLWCETLLPDDGLIDVWQLCKGSTVIGKTSERSNDPTTNAHRHKTRFMQRLQHLRHAVNQKKTSRVNMPSVAPILTSEKSTHDLHKFSHQGQRSQSGHQVSNGFHFHLAGCINPNTDIPMLPSMTTEGSNAKKLNFCVHWLNNKELQFTHAAEVILDKLRAKDLVNQRRMQAEEDMKERQSENEDSEECGEPITVLPSASTNKTSADAAIEPAMSASTTSLIGTNSTDVVDGTADFLDEQIENLLNDWHQNADMLYSVHPIDGSFLVWRVEWLDDNSAGSFRQARICVSSRIPTSFPLADARSMSNHLLLFSEYHRLMTTDPDSQVGSSTTLALRSPNIQMVSKHDNGTLNLWRVNFSPTSKFSTVLCVAHTARVSGHRFQTNHVSCHPVLPLMLTTSHHNVPRAGPTPRTAAVLLNRGHKIDPGPGGFCSELILWSVQAVGALSRSGGISELARINSPETGAFSNVAWLPTLLPSSSAIGRSPSTLFVASDENQLRIYQAVIDGRRLLQGDNDHVDKDDSFGDSTTDLLREPHTATTTSSPSPAAPPSSPSSSANIVSLQSTACPGAVISLDAIADSRSNNGWRHVELFHVFQEQLITGRREDQGKMDEPMIDLQDQGSFSENFYLVVITRTDSGICVLHMWRIVISSDGDETSEFSEDNPNYTTTNEDNKSNDKLKIFTTKVCTQPLLFESGAQLISATTAAGHLSSSSIYPACFAPYLISTLSSEGSARFWKCQPTDDLDNFNWVEWKMMIHKSPNSNCINLPGKPVCISCAYNGRLAIAYKPMHQIDTTSSNANTTKNTITLFVAIYECESTGGSDWSLEDTIELKNIPLKVVTPAAQANLDLSAIFGPDVDAGPLATGSRRVSLAPGVPSLKSRVSVPSIATIECVRRRLSTPGAHHRASSTATHAAHTRKPIQLDWVTTEDGAHILTIAAGTTIALYASVSSEVSKGIRREDAQAAAQLAATNAQRNSSTIGAMTQRHSSSYKNSLKRKHAHQTMEDIRWMKLRSIELETADGALPSPTHISWVRDGLLVVGMENEMHVYSQWHSSSSSSQSSSRNRMRSSNDKTDSKSPAHHDQRLLTQSKLHKVMSMSNISTGRQTMLSTSFSTMTSQNASIPGSTPATTLPSASSIVNLTKISELKEEKRAHALRQYSDSSRTSTCTAASSSTSTSTTTTTTGSGDIAGDNDMLQCGLFEAARLANPVLPQYHPKQLLELLNFGRMQRVRAILAHLLRCISGSSLEEAGGEGVGAGAPRKASRKAEAVAGRQRLFSAPMVTVNNKDPTAHTNETQGGVTDYVEIACIPPLPLYALLAVDNDTVCLADNEDNSDLIHRDPSEEKVNEGDDEYNALFVVGDVNDETDDMFIVDGEETTDGLSKKQLKHCPTRFGTAESSHLAEHLTRIQLPGLSRLDQMYLLALADTVANTSLDSTNIPKPVSTSDGQQNSQVSETTGHIDESGLKYMLAARHFSYMQNSAPARLRQANKASLAPASFIWAFHSDSADDLLNVVPSYRRGTPLWSEMREFGVGWWLKSVATLRRLVEKMAKSAFQLKKDPMDAALYYMAMKKKNVIWGLFRSINDDRMTAFFRNDFTQPRWHQAALKNAFSLLGKQRFHHAAAFFLLGGAVDDAVEVCISKLNDLQLAMVILRLYDNDRNVPVPDRLKTLLKTECLGIKLGKNSESNSSFDQAYADSDPFIRSIAHWILKDYSSALNTLLDSTSGAERKTSDHHNSSSPSPSSAVTNDYESGSISGGSGAMGAGGSSGSSDYSVLSGSVFNFYNFLRTHPLLLRQSLADNSSTAKAVMLAGFSNKFDQNNAVDEKLDTDVSSIAASLKISPVERRLYFTTAHAHFRSGCPALALEVLSKLPDVALEDECDQSLDQSDDRMSVISTSSESHKETADALFSDPPASNQTGSGGGGIDDFDWSTPAFKVQEEELDLAFSDDGDSTTSTLEGEACAPDQALNDTIDSTATTATTATTTTTTEASRKAAQTSSHGAGDIMAHQLKFVACLKIMMEELSTLATGFEINAGQLRYHLYVWLEKAVEVLRLLCNYGVNAHADEDTDSTEPRVRTATLMSTYSDLPLHEAIIAEQNDFEEKLRMTSRRRRWLHLHQQLLRTLLSYSVLHGCGGGGLASVRMELILLLQELQQERTTRKQLTSPLPFPTTLPLLTSSIARTVIVNPIRHIENMTSDLLKSTAAMKSPPSLGDCPVVIEKMRTMAAGLSACIYQCLCDSEEFLSIGQTDARMEGFTTANVVYRDSYLMTGAVVKRRSSFNVHKTNQPNSSPSKWPGVSCLQSLLIRRQDPAQTPLFTLLLESSVAVYSALLNHALSTYDPNLLYRLVANTFVERMWPLLFGGGVRSLARETPQPPRKSVDSGKGVESPVGSVNKDSEMIKMRLKQHRKLLEASGRVNSSTATNNKASTSTDDKPTFREKFVAPKDSMLAYFLTKPVLMVSDTSTAQTDYDSSDSVCSTDDEDDDSFIGNPSALKEHLDPNSYSWCLMRYAIVKFVHQRLQSFLPQIGIELPDLAIRSPMVQASLTTLESWQRSLKARLELFASPPKDYIPGCYVEEGVTGKPAILKYKTLLEPSNTPFLSTHYSASPAKRLWSYLVLQQPIHAIFIRYIFKKSPKPGSIHYDSQDSVQMKTDPVRIVHKDQDVVSAFCINQVNRDHIALTTQKELIEMNIGNALRLPSWLEDTTEYDIEQINHPTQRPIDSGEFLVVETPSDRKASTNGFARSVSTVTGALSRSPSGGMDAGLAGSEVIGISLMKALNRHVTATKLCPVYLVDRSLRLIQPGCKRSISGIRRMSSHPYLPYYLTGSHDGSVRLWEWGHRECVSIPRSAGHYPKVSKVAFTAHGNKFGVGDSEGSVYLWQIGVGTSISKPFLHLHCHGKALNDFVFMGSSSVISTAGYSIENRNVAIWDTLLPPRSSLVQSFSCHPDGSSAVVYAAQHQILISAGKRGDICIFDVRQRQLRHSFQAHESNTAIRSMCLQPNESYFATGAIDGSMKIWNLGVHNLVHSFGNQHVKGSIFRSSLSSGPGQLELTKDGTLLSCGADGSMKIRQLRADNNIVQVY